MVRTTVIAGLTLAIVSTLAACGSGDRTTSGPDPATVAAIRHSITVSFTSDDPALCTQNATPTLVENVFGSLAKCRREQRHGKPARSVSISELAVSGDTAHARVAPSGGTNDGQEFRLTVVKIGGAWKLDDIRYLYGSDPKTDRQVNLLFRELRGPGPRLVGAPAARCVRSRLLVAFRSAGVPFGNHELADETKAVLAGCIRSDPSSARALRRIFFNRLRLQIEKGLGPDAAKCLINGLRRVIGTSEMIALIQGERPTSLIAKAKAVGRRCGSIQAILHAFDDFAQT